MHTRVESTQAHSQSLEEKHTHARQALEHFREASKEQRERELRQHEQQLQYLQTELTKSNAAALASLQQMRNDHQQNQALSRELGSVKSKIHQLETQLQAAQEAAQAFTDIPDQLAEATAKSAVREQDFSRLQSDLFQANERNLDLERRLAATTAADITRQQLTTDLLRRLDALPGINSPGRRT